MEIASITPNITTVDEHSVCLELLPTEAKILDAGCAGFGFTKYFHELGHSVLACDIQDLGPENAQNYLRMGLYFHAGKCRVSDDVDPQARHITDIHLFDKTKPFPKELKEGEVFLSTIEGCARAIGVEKFDLIKLDIEGAEVPILQNATHPIAPQVSVEFHAHTGRQSKKELDHLLKWLEKWYDIYGAVWEERHAAGYNYWDVLLISK